MALPLIIGICLVVGSLAYIGGLLHGLRFFTRIQEVERGLYQAKAGSTSPVRGNVKTGVFERPEPTTAPPTSRERPAKEPFQRGFVSKAPPVDGPPPTGRERPRPLKEGKVKKGGLNDPPTTPKPDIRPGAQGEPSIFNTGGRGA